MVRHLLQPGRLNGKSIRIGLSLALVMLFILLEGTSPLPATSRALFAHVQPGLPQIAAEHPDLRVQIIVQKSISDSSVEAAVARLGGVVTRDLRIINAFAAELPAGAVPQLAQSVGIRWISLDAPVAQTADPCTECIPTGNLVNAYVRAIGADQVWNKAPYLQGQDVTVAVVDSGVAYHDDLKGRILTSNSFASTVNNPGDQYGHGTHIAGIVGGNGKLSDGAYIGIAPKVNLVNVKVSNTEGVSRTSDVVAGLQWIYENKTKYNIKVVNLSLNSTAIESYNVSPLDAALEILWFNRIVVVVSAGNRGNALYPPANDPFVITVGSVDDRGTADLSDDVLASYSAFGMTSDGFAKPDLVAPGTNIISLLASPSERLYKEHPENRVEDRQGRDHYFRMSGTSMASAVTTGAVSILLQSNPGLNPDQVKYRLKATARPFGAGTGAGYLDLYKAVLGNSTKTANTGTLASHLLFTGQAPAPWENLAWDSVEWGSVEWGSVEWGSVEWGSVEWGSDYWGK